MLEPQSQFDPGFAPFGGGANSTVLHPVVAVASVAIVLLIFRLPRRQVIVPLLLGLFLIPAGQGFYLAGIHLYLTRLLILLGWVRALTSRPAKEKFLSGGFQSLDLIFLVWALYRALAVFLQYMAMGAAVNQVAFLLDALGGYFLFRTLVRTVKDLPRVITILAVVTLICACTMVVEIKTGQNPFGQLGGVKLLSDVRNGRIRAQGVFQHAILAGTFAATAFPLFVCMYRLGKAKLMAVTGCIASVVMILTCASSTPVGALIGSIFAISLWPIRNRLRFLRWGIVVLLVFLQFTMQAPIWYVLAHIDFTGGSSGWERGFLLDTFARHIGDWWLIGTHDNPNWGWDMWDQANQFVQEGESGGLLALGCLIAMIVVGFKRLGRARRRGGSANKEWFYWLLGITLFAHLLAFMGVDYFDQTKYSWYIFLAIVPASMYWPKLQEVKAPNKVVRNETALPAIAARY